MLRQIKRWLRLHRARRRRRRRGDPPLDPRDLQDAMRNHLVSSRLVRIQAARSAKALRRLSEALAIRAKAIDSIAAAEDALSALDGAKRDDE